MNPQFNVRLIPELAECVRAYAKMCDLTNDAAASKLISIGLATHTTGMTIEIIEPCEAWQHQQRGRRMRLAWRALLATEEKPR